MPLYGSVPPTGYNWRSSTWVSTGALVNRMNFALALAANKFNGVAASWDGNASTMLTAPAAFTVDDSQGARAVRLRRRLRQRSSGWKRCSFLAE